jgi:broad specificity phosphatase PhoE
MISTRRAFIRFLSGAIALASLSGTTVAHAQQARGATTVILVRHAEKATEPAPDPPLTAAGEARAKALVDVARDAGVTAVITTQFARTKNTGQPLAAAFGITPEIVEARGAQHPQAVAQVIRDKHAGEVVLVVGHSNTIPAIIAALGAKAPPAICDSEYDGLYVVTVPRSGTVRVIHARYGEASAKDASCAAMSK